MRGIGELADLQHGEILTPVAPSPSHPPYIPLQQAPPPPTTASNGAATSAGSDVDLDATITDPAAIRKRTDSTGQHQISPKMDKAAMKEVSQSTLSGSGEVLLEPPPPVGATGTGATPPSSSLVKSGLSSESELEAMPPPTLSKPSRPSRSPSSSPKVQRKPVRAPPIPKRSSRTLLSESTHSLDSAGSTTSSHERTGSFTDVASAGQRMSMEVQPTGVCVRV